MQIVKYVCDRCGKEIDPFNAYLVKVEWINKKDYLLQSYGNSIKQPLNTEKHMCVSCAKTTFEIDSDGSQKTHGL